jgi:hypothetical protein
MLVAKRAASRLRNPAPIFTFVIFVAGRRCARARFSRQRVQEDGNALRIAARLFSFSALNRRQYGKARIVYSCQVALR